MLTYSRRLLRSGRARLTAALLSLAYALFSMGLGGMLRIAASTSGPAFSFAASASGFRLTLEVATVSSSWGPAALTALIAIVTGVGLSIGLELTRRVLGRRPNPGSVLGPAATVAALSPGMLALVTVGACCSTVAAAVGPGAAALSASLGGSPFATAGLGLVQLALVFGAVLVQERIVAAFADLIGLGRGAPGPSRADPGRSARRALTSFGFRSATLAAVPMGALAAAFLFSGSPQSPPGAAVLGGLLRDQALAAVVLVSALGPAGLTLLGLSGRWRSSEPWFRGFGLGIAGPYAGDSGAPASAGARIGAGPPTGSRAAPDPSADAGPARWGDPVGRWCSFLHRGSGQTDRSRFGPSLRAVSSDPTRRPRCPYGIIRRTERT